MHKRSDFRAVFEKPYTTALDLATLRDGLYLIEGALEQGQWEEMCERLGEMPFGAASVRLEVEKSGIALRVDGEINIKLNRTCVRTGVVFEQQMLIPVREVFSLVESEQENGQTDTDFFEESAFVTADFMAEQIVLALPMHPVAPGQEGAEAWGDVPDNFEKAEKNSPFAVLATLKKKRS